jgi:hypothetical protein
MTPTPDAATDVLTRCQTKLDASCRIGSVVQAN